jgi:chromosome segregation ATPase
MNLVTRILNLFRKDAEIERLMQEKSKAVSELSEKIAEIEQLKREFASNKGTNSQTSNDEYVETLRTQLTEKENHIKKLKKEVEDLEERAEEAEDDAKNAKKRLEGVIKEQNELKNSYREIENLYTAKKQEFKALAIKSEELKIELKSVKGTLNP